MSARGIQVNITLADDWYDRPDARFTLGEWKAAVEGLKRFMDMPVSRESTLEVELHSQAI